MRAFAILAAFAFILAIAAACSSSTTPASTTREGDAADDATDATSDASDGDASMCPIATPFVFGSARCNECARFNCCTPITSCVDSPQCKALMECELQCFSELDAGACAHDCEARFDKATRDAWLQVDDCVYFTKACIPHCSTVR